MRICLVELTYILLLDTARRVGSSWTAEFCELLGVGGGVENLPRFLDVGHSQDLPGQLTPPLIVHMRIQRGTVTCPRSHSRSEAELGPESRALA